MNQPKMTPWFPPEIKPKYVGEYNASSIYWKTVLRWWNGKNWSKCYLPNDSKLEKAIAKKTKAHGLLDIHWRGLASKPNGWKP